MRGRDNSNGGMQVRLTCPSGAGKGMTIRSAWFFKLRHCFKPENDFLSGVKLGEVTLRRIRVLVVSCQSGSNSF